MILRAVEILFKHKVLIILPSLVIMPLMIMIAVQPKPQKWETYSVVWVDQYKPLYEEARLGYAPTETQANLLKSFLATRTFATRVAEQTQLAALLDDPQTAELAMREVWRSVLVWTSGWTFITMRVSTTDPDLTYEIAQAVLASFQEEVRLRSEEQGQVGTTYFNQELQRAEQALTKSQNDLATYIAAHPELGEVSSRLQLPLTARDPNLAQLTAQVGYDQEAYNRARAKYDEVKANAGAGLQAQPFTFTVMDEPERPLYPIRSSRLGLVKLPVIGFVLSLNLSGAIAALLILTNRAVLGAFDLRRATTVPVLGEVPELRRRRWLWQRRPRNAVRLRLAAPAHLPSASKPAV